MLLTRFCLMLPCLRLRPDRSQFFRYDSIALSCEDQMNSTGWKVKRNTSVGGVRPCSSNWGSAPSASTCVLKNTYPSDSGEYWCESDDEERSNSVNITVTDRSVILESPALPVPEGNAVTLRCNAETAGHRFDFYKDGVSIRSGSSGEMTIRSVSKSDEGLYKCSISGGEESEGSWLAVEESLPPTPAAPSSLPVLRLVCHLVVGVPYLLSTIVLGLICRDQRRERRGSNKVVMETAV